MPLDYLKLQGQIKKMAETAEHHQQEMVDKLALCQQLLGSQAANLIALQQKVEETVSQDKNFRCAVPVAEPLDANFPAPAVSTLCTVLSADGSQITPNAHEAVFYGLVNIGLFIMRPGSGLAPETRTLTDLVFDEENSDEHELITEELINLRRDVAERRALAQFSASLPTPVVTLTDGPLELYHEPRENPNYRKYFDKYLDALSDMALEGTITAGYIDRPRASLLVNLLEIADSPDPSVKRFTGLTDLALMRPLLAPGERSAIFKMQSSSSKEYKDNLELHFFYLNVGSAAHPALARVEIPRWVAANSASVDLLHAVLLEQSRQAGLHPYPYALLRAHETAVVKLDESEALKDLIQKELLQHGIPLSVDSEKLANKKVGARTRYNS
jgi:hypothetical protein